LDSLDELHSLQELLNYFNANISRDYSILLAPFFPATAHSAGFYLDDRNYSTTSSRPVTPLPHSKEYNNKELTKPVVSVYFNAYTEKPSILKDNLNKAGVYK
jgi:hypothetical protein